MLKSFTSDPLTEELRRFEYRADPNFWSYAKNGRRRGAHALMHYPAMMVPGLQGTILDCIKIANPGISKVLDPFSGSGTVLVEAMSRGLDFFGVDVNPLAVLACRAKAGPYFAVPFGVKAEALMTRIERDRKKYTARTFPGSDKWFSPETAASLERIAQGIAAEPALWARRLFWLAMCRAIRSSSNSRLSTYKLHIRGKTGPTAHADPQAVFQEALFAIQQHVLEQKELFAVDKRLVSDRYPGLIQTEVGDAGKILKRNRHVGVYDVVMTSPPYGDNQTTIPYGQFAYLPLQWIDWEDISTGLDKSTFLTTHAIDSASLGGSLKNAEDQIESLSTNYKAAKKFIHSLSEQENGKRRFAVFFSDLEKTIESISGSTALGGYQAWTVGSRRICGKQVPMDGLLTEMLAKKNVTVIGQIKRSILQKKMAHRNNVSATMLTETILLAKKAER